MTPPKIDISTISAPTPIKLKGPKKIEISPEHKRIRVASIPYSRYAGDRIGINHEQESCLLQSEYSMGRTVHNNTPIASSSKTLYQEKPQMSNLLSANLDELYKDDGEDGITIPDVVVFKKWHDYINPLVYMNHYKVGTILGTTVLVVCGFFAILFSLLSSIEEDRRFREASKHEKLSPFVYSSLSAIRTSLVDPDTPLEFLSKNSSWGDSWKLVFSDEFNTEGRTFYEGDDQFWTGVDLHYAATNDLEYYKPDMITTRNGTLQIKIDKTPTNGLEYRSGMLQSWNKLCFNSKAIFEVSVKLPGAAHSRGYWPAIWTLGNLGRAGYMASTDGTWPYTYDECDIGITPNQSSPDGISFLSGQRLNKCVCYKEDHPNVGVGRGAPEIDVLEGNHNENFPFGSQTLQVAPFDPWWLPDYNFMSINDANLTSISSNVGNPAQEAITSETVLNSNWYENGTTENDFQSYGFEYDNNRSDTHDSYIKFYVAGSPTLTVSGSSLHPEGDIGWRQISKEPMSIIMNLAISHSWSFIDFGSLTFPATLEVDYIRIYQPEGEEEMTCDPSNYPTSEYINSHRNAYEDFNLTSWKSAGYRSPKNSLMDGCSWRGNGH